MKKGLLIVLLAASGHQLAAQGMYPVEACLQFHQIAIASCQDQDAYAMDRMVAFREKFPNHYLTDQLWLRQGNLAMDMGKEDVAENCWKHAADPATNFPETKETSLKGCPENESRREEKCWFGYRQNEGNGVINSAGHKLAGYYLELGRYEEALKYHDLAVKDYPDYGWCGNGIADQKRSETVVYYQCYAGLGRKEEALDVLAKDGLFWATGMYTYYGNQVAIGLEELYGVDEVRQLFAKAMENIETRVRKIGEGEHTFETEDHILTLFGREWVLPYSPTLTPQEVVEESGIYQALFPTTATEE